MHCIKNSYAVVYNYITQNGLIPACFLLFFLLALSVWFLTDSVWPIYIPPDELGLRCGIQGPGVLTLQNQKPGLSMSKLEIYSMANHQVPVLSCKHNEIRRTGKMGLFLYVEIGSRSKYGAGLLWMYFGSSNKKASSMRDLMCKYVQLMFLNNTSFPLVKQIATCSVPYWG